MVGEKVLFPDGTSRLYAAENRVGDDYSCSFARSLALCFENSSLTLLSRGLGEIVECCLGATLPVWDSGKREPHFDAGQGAA